MFGLIILVYFSNSRRVDNIVVVHGPLDGHNTHALWAIHIYTNNLHKPLCLVVQRQVILSLEYIFEHDIEFLVSLKCIGEENWVKRKTNCFAVPLVTGGLCRISKRKGEVNSLASLNLTTAEFSMYLHCSKTWWSDSEHIWIELCERFTVRLMIDLVISLNLKTKPSSLIEELQMLKRCKLGHWSNLDCLFCCWMKHQHQSDQSLTIIFLCIC
jgi:hypothetical protein